jgi:DNA-binding MarR family transcriptional regulator
MDYDDLSLEFIQNMRSVQTANKQKSIQDTVRGEVFVLYCIKENQGKTVPSLISDTMGVSSARVAMALNSLEEKGMITREIDVEDRRKIIVKLTSKGADHVEEWHKRYMENVKEILMQLGEEDATELVRIIGRLAEVLSKTQLK